MKYLRPTFSVNPGASDEYRRNYEAVFGRRSEEHLGGCSSYECDPECPVRRAAEDGSAEENR